ncbi:MAG TPA: copper resistance protein B [Rhodocyclaceae bacterium]|nr:copper resistance protein B [Rhodocyclaceae bacterium]
MKRPSRPLHAERLLRGCVAPITHWFGQTDPEEVIGSGLSTVEGGVRMRYEITRRFSPCVGFEREWSFGKASDLRELGSHSRAENRWVFGLYFWF